MNIQKAYDTWSATYDSDENRTRDLDRVVTEKTLANSRYKSILEIGCGTGKNTRFLSQIGERVHAIDFSEGMISLSPILHTRGTIIMHLPILSSVTSSLSM